MTKGSAQTLIFEGHGKRTGWRFGGELSAVDVGNALGRGGARHAGEPTIVIPVTCFGHDFVRNMLERLARDKDVELPIVIVPEEFGQVFVKTADDRFLVRGLGLEASETATLSRVWQGADPRVTIYVPGQDNVPMQIL
jgi:hypothetical protein